MVISFALNALDIILLFLLGRGAYVGYQHGLIQTLAQLLGLIAAIAVATYLSPWILQKIGQENIPFQTIILPFIVIFVGVWMIGNLMGRLVKNMVPFRFMKEIDALCGSMFGMIIWSIWTSISLIWIEKIQLKWSQPYLTDSLLWKHAQNYAYACMAWMEQTFAYTIQ